MELIIAVAVWMVCWLLPVGAIIFTFNRLMNRPLVKRERVRLFLILLDVGLKDGRRVEDTIVSLAETRDPGLGPKFRTLATALRSRSLRLSEALETIPGFLPKQIVAMLKAGEKLGDMSKVMPACRQLVKDSLALTRNSVHYLLVATFATTPVAIVILAVLSIYVLPQFHAVTEGMGAETPAGLQLLYSNMGGVICVELLILFVVWMVASYYIGVPPIFYWLGQLLPEVADRINFALPWKHKRLQRDFSTILALLMDGGVPEAEAVTLAADCTANEVFKERARRVVKALNEGVKLTEALRALDDSGELHWRLKNAFHAHGGFFKALAGWNESLEAKAFQQEQSAAQAVTAGCVVLNGLFVGFVVVSLFSGLVAIINMGILW